MATLFSESRDVGGSVANGDGSAPGGSGAHRDSRQDLAISLILLEK